MTEDDFMQKEIHLTRCQKITVALAWALTFALGIFAIACTSGCATTGGERGGLIAQAAVVYATAKVIENNPDHAPRIAAIAGEVRALASGESVDTVDAVIAIARSKIDWSKLSPADTALVNLLLEAVGAELTARLGAGVLPPGKALVVAKVAGWIEQAAKAAVPSSQD